MPLGYATHNSPEWPLAVIDCNSLFPSLESPKNYKIFKRSKRKMSIKVQMPRKPRITCKVCTLLITLLRHFFNNFFLLRIICQKRSKRETGIQLGPKSTMNILKVWVDTIPVSCHFVLKMKIVSCVKKSPSKNLPRSKMVLLSGCNNFFWGSPGFF